MESLTLKIISCLFSLHVALYAGRDEGVFFLSTGIFMPLDWLVMRAILVMGVTVDVTFISQSVSRSRTDDQPTHPQKPGVKSSRAMYSMHVP